MTSIKTLSVAAALLAGSALSAQAEELHFIMWAAKCALPTKK